MPWVPDQSALGSPLLSQSARMPIRSACDRLRWMSVHTMCRGSSPSIWGVRRALGSARAIVLIMSISTAHSTACLNTYQLDCICKGGCVTTRQRQECSRPNAVEVRLLSLPPDCNQSNCLTESTEPNLLDEIQSEKCLPHHEKGLGTHGDQSGYCLVVSWQS